MRMESGDLLSRRSLDSIRRQIRNPLIEFFLRQVLFSEEKKFCLDGPNGFNYYWRDLRKKPLFFTRRNFGGGSVMCWGCFGNLGKVDLAFPSHRITSAEYQDVLGSTLMPFLTIVRRLDITFQQDNASVHRSKSTKRWLAANKIEVLERPACSPDLNPMESLWRFLVSRIYANNKKYASKEELKRAIEEAWVNIEPGIIKNLVESMPKRIFEVPSRKDRPIDY